MKMLYISYGNIPSLWAHTVQMMKMAEAFSAVTHSSAIITRAHIKLLLRRPFDYKKFYGLKKRIKVIHLYTDKGPLGPIQEKIFFPEFAERAVSYAQSHNFDLIYTRAPEIALMAVQSNLDTILETHMNVDNKRFQKIIETSQSARFKGLVTISEFLARNYQQAGMLPAKIIVWPDAVSLKSFSDLPQKPVLRKRLKLHPEKTIAVYCGHLYENRGIKEILLVARELSNIHFLFVGGWDKDVAKYKKQSDGLPNVQFIGFVSNDLVPSYLAASDMILMPYSRSCETAKWMSPMKLFEAMASSRPIIASNLGSIGVFLEDRRNALLIEPDDEKALMTAAQTLLEHSDMGAEMASAALGDVQSLTWEKRAADILAKFAPQFCRSSLRYEP
ncbi:glycosyltransferase [Candidatus Acetothermia bacterium]|nr:glycosyltransferase [Candidatus Acetothermia bacterium]MBI3643587.1 glycosyltransferase [Candidatus Acetothermia bacterium]